MKKLLFLLLVGLFCIFSVVAAPATDTSCGDVGSDLTLTADVASNYTCFTIIANDVTLDCNGHSINYSINGSDGYAIAATLRSNVTVRNCRIFEGNVSPGTYPAVSFYVDDGKFENNYIEMIDESQTAFSFGTGSTGNTFHNNTILVLGNLSWGVSIGEGCHNNIISSNYINMTQNESRTAITLSSNFGNTLLANNLITYSESHDVLRLSSSNSTLVSLNTITAGGSSGISILSNSNLNIFHNNLILSPASEIYDDTGPTRTNLLVYNNSQGQIRWTSSNITIDGELDIGEEVILDANLVGLEAVAGLANLNSTAEITFRGLPVMSYAPLLYRNGVECTGCVINSFAGGVVVATVPGFSNYSTYDNSANGTRCGYVKGDLTLASGINSTGTCLTVNASNIVIDCAGNWVNYTGSGYAIDITGQSNVTVKNCRIMNQGSPTLDSIYLYRSGNCVLKNITMNDMSGTRFIGIYNWMSNNTQIIDSYIYGDKFTEVALTVNASSGVTIENNDLGGTLALLIEESNGTSVLRNRFTIGAGAIRRIHLNSSDSNTLNGNNMTISGVGADAVLLSSSDSNTLQNNRISTNGNGAYGFKLIGSDGNTISSNMISSLTTENPAILLDASDSNTIEDNLLNTSHYMSYGVELKSQASGNTLRNNNISSIGIMDRTNSSVTNTMSYSTSFGSITWSTGAFAQNLTCNGTELSLARFIFAANLAAMNYSGFVLGRFNSSATVSLANSGVSSANRIYHYEGVLTSAEDVLEQGAECQGSFCGITSAGSDTVTFTTDRIGSFASKLVGGGGGSGGGSSSSPPGWKARKQWTRVLKGEILAIFPSDMDSSVLIDKIELKMANTRSSVALQVRSHDANPTPRFIGAIKFIEISATNLGEGDYDGMINISFSLHAKDVKDSSKVSLYRYVSGDWVKIETVLLRQQGQKLYYMASVPGFSFFAISEEAPVSEPSSGTEPSTPSSAPTSQPSATTMPSAPSETVSPVAPSEPGQAAPKADDKPAAPSKQTKPVRQVTSKKSLGGFFLLLGLIIAAGAVVFAVVKKKR